MSKSFMSTSGTILSLDRRRHLSLDSREAQAHRVCGRVEHDGDLARLELLPGPQPNQFTIRLVEFAERYFEMRVGVLGAGWLSDEKVSRCTIDHSSDELQAPGRTSAVIGEAAPCDPIRPGQRIVERDVVEATPDHEQSVVDEFHDVCRLRPSTQVPLERLGHHVDHGFELSAAFAICLHRISICQRNL